MSEISMYEAQKKKMEGLCDEHELIYAFKKNSYPITFTIRPMQGMDAQMSMLENVEEVGYRSPDASMMWIFEDGALTTKVSGGTFTISKTLRQKIESILLKMINYWQQYFFRDVIEKGSLKNGMEPVIDEAEAEDDEIEDDEDEINAPEDGADDQDEGAAEGDLDPEDPIISEAIKIVRADNKATVSLLQRRLNIGYSKAAQIIDILEEMDVVGPYAGSEPRGVLPADLPDDEEGADNE